MLLNDLGINCGIFINKKELLYGVDNKNLKKYKCQGFS